MALLATPNSVAGPDGITGRLLRQLASELALPLSIMFPQSLMQGCFPSSWKEAVMESIYKGSGPKD